MKAKRGLRRLLVLTVVLFVAAGWRQGTGQPPDRGADRTSRVVVTVRDSGFHWEDAGIGAAAVAAATFVALGLVLALRPDRSGGNP